MRGKWVHSLSFTHQQDPSQKAQVLIGTTRTPFLPGSSSPKGLRQPLRFRTRSAQVPGPFSSFPPPPSYQTPPFPKVASSGDSWLRCSSAVLFFLGYSKGCGNSHRCGEGKPLSPLPRCGKEERPRRPGPGLVQPLWSLGPVGRGLRVEPWEGGAGS